MKTNIVLRNDGVWLWTKGEKAKNLYGQKMVLPYNGEDKTVEIFGYTCITYDYRVYGSTSLDLSDSIPPEEIKRKLAEVGIAFQEYLIPGNAMKRSQLRNFYNTNALFEVLGIVKGEGWIHLNDGLVMSKYSFWHSGSSDPYKLLRFSDVQKEVVRRTNEARHWINQAFPGFLRKLKLSDPEVVDLFEYARRATIIRHGVGEKFNVRWQGSSYFGSGGANGSWLVWGAVNVVQEAGSNDNGFVRSGSTEIQFDGPGVLYTYAGDSINGGRTFWRELHIAVG